MGTGRRTYEDAINAYFFSATIDDHLEKSPVCCENQISVTSLIANDPVAINL
jgi:hypothetical protein